MNAARNFPAKAQRRLRSTPLFATYAKASLLAGAAAAPVSALADFSGPYSVNPPANGTYLNTSANGAFGNWTGAWSNPSSGGVSLNTSTAPSLIGISLNDSAFNTTGTYSFLVTAAATGLVSFDFSGSNFNGSVLFEDTTTSFSSALNGVNLFSTNVSAGDTFGFKLTATYFGSASLTVSNFSGPVPTTNGVPEQGSSLALFALGFVGLMAYRATARRAVARV